MVRPVPKWFTLAETLPWLAPSNSSLVGHVGSEMLGIGMDSRGMLMDSPIGGVLNTRT